MLYAIIDFFQTIFNFLIFLIAIIICIRYAIKKNKDYQKNEKI